MNWGNQKWDGSGGDPWALVKLMPAAAAAQDAADKVAKKRRGDEAAISAELRRKGLHPDRFTAYKQSIDGAQTRRDYRPGLTIEDVHALPLGLQQDHAGAYVWAYGINGGTML